MKADISTLLKPETLILRRHTESFILTKGVGVARITHNFASAPRAKIGHRCTQLVWSKTAVSRGLLALLTEAQCLSRERGSSRSLSWSVSRRMPSLRAGERADPRSQRQHGLRNTVAGWRSISPKTERAVGSGLDAQPAAPAGGCERLPDGGPSRSSRRKGHGGRLAWGVQDN